MAGLLDLVGLVGIVISLVAMVRGRVRWARLATRRAASGALVASLAVTAIGGSLAPASTQRAATLTATTPSQPTPSVEPSTSPTETQKTSAGDPDAADATSTSPVSTFGLNPAPPVSPSACRPGDPLKNVYHPYRLQVVRSCASAAGMVRSVRSEDDGDVHFDLALDAPYAAMLTPGNSRYQHGWLVVELVPADEPGCSPSQPPRSASGSYDYGLCTGANEPPPRRWGRT